MKTATYFAAPRVLGFLFAAAVTLSSAQAQTGDPASALPDDPLYQAKISLEERGLKERLNRAALAHEHLRLADVRLQEAQAMTEKGKPEFVEQLLGERTRHIDAAIQSTEELAARGKDVDPLVEQIESTTHRHVEVLTGVLERAPEAARPGLERALAASQKHHGERLNTIKEPPSVERANKVRGKFASSTGAIKPPPASRANQPGRPSHAGSPGGAASGRGR